MDRFRAFEGRWSGVASAAAVAGLLAGLASCGPAAREEARRNDVTPATAPVSPAGRGGIASAPSERQVVAIRITPGTIEISPATVRPGSATIRVTNTASVPYDVEIEGPGEDGEIDDLQPNSTQNVPMMLERGTYEIEATSEEGPEREMTAYLTVRD